jgi:tetratricopeptide (TPR) repeat protein
VATDRGLSELISPLSRVQPSAAVRAWSSWVLLWAGDTASAQFHASAALRQAPQGIFGLTKGPRTVLAEIALSRGDTATALEYLAQSETFLERTLERVPSPWAYFNLAMIHAMRDESEEAIRDLERAYDLGISFPWFYEQEATLDSLRDDPGYRVLMDRVRATWEGQRERVLADGLVG